MNAFWDAFNFTKISIVTINSMVTPRHQFWSIVRSDGVAVDFVFGQPKCANVPEKMMADIDLDLSRDQLWGVDPGITNVFVAMDGSGNVPHKIQKMSMKEFYHISGWIKATYQRQWLKKVNLAIQAIEDDMPSSKMTSTTIFDMYVIYILEHYRELVAFYDNCWREMRFQQF